MNTKKFAELCGVEKRTLFYYDEIGLLKPETVKENGYREYQARQVERMDSIKLMQAAGFTLEEIRERLSATKEEKNDIILEALSRLEEKIEDLRSVSEYIVKKRELCYDFVSRKDEILCEQLSFHYDEKPVEYKDNVHFYSYLSDGLYSAFTYDGQMTEIEKLVYVHEKGKKSVSGKFLVFYATDMPSAKKLSAYVKEVLLKEGVREVKMLLCEPVPHFYIGDDHNVLKVMVLTKEEEQKKTGQE